MNKMKLIKVWVCILGVFVLSACGTPSGVESELPEIDHSEEESIEIAEENEIEEKEEVIENIGENEIEEKEVIENNEETVERMTPREALDYMFDYLYPDKSDMVDIFLVDRSNNLSYTFFFMDVYVATNETEPSNPWTLYLCSTTEDGLYYEFAEYEEIWDTVSGEERDYKEFSHSSYSNYWYVNAETKEIIPMKLFNDEAEDDPDEDFLIFNEEYSEITRKYSTYEGHQ